MVMEDVPGSTPTGVSVTVRFDPFPPKTMLLTGNRFVFDEVAATVSRSASASASLTVNGIGAVDRASGVPWFGMSEITGVRLVTLSQNELLRVRPPASITVNVMLTEPVALVAGEMASVRLLNEPPRNRFWAGTMFVFELAAERSKSAAEVSTSLIAMWMGALV